MKKLFFLFFLISNMLSLSIVNVKAAESASFAGSVAKGMVDALNENAGKVVAAGAIAAGTAAIGGMATSAGRSFGRKVFDGFSYVASTRFGQIFMAAAAGAGTYKIWDHYRSLRDKRCLRARRHHEDIHSEDTGAGAATHSMGRGLGAAFAATNLELFIQSKVMTAIQEVRNAQSSLTDTAGRLELQGKAIADQQGHISASIKVMGAVNDERQRQTDALIQRTAEIAATVNELKGNMSGLHATVTQLPATLLTMTIAAKSAPHV